MRVETLASELEVSERTVYRDLVALDTAGVPIVTERGPGGGCSLVEGYTTRLTGLTEEEGAALSIALFSGGMPKVPADLGMGKAYDSARLKLAAALPSRLRGEETAARSRILVDSGGRVARAGSKLSIVHEALMRGVALRIVQILPYGPVAGLSLERRVEPYGLVATGADWRLVGFSDGRIRSIMVGEIREALPLESEPVLIPSGFDLAEYWARVRQEEEAQGRAFSARMRVEPEAAMLIAGRFGHGLAEAVTEAGKPGPGGRVEIELFFAAIEEAIVLLPILGASVEVLAPEELRAAIADRTRAVLDLYRKGGSGKPFAQDQEGIG